MASPDPTTVRHDATTPVPPQPSKLSTVLGYPRIGPNRELKKATEAYWSGEIDAARLLAAGAAIRLQNWTALQTAGVDQLPCNDFSFYDHMLDTLVLLGAIPDRHDDRGVATDDDATLRRYFAMARGSDAALPLEMTKWFNTNYHYLVPELSTATRFELDARKPLGELAEALALGVDARPVVVGPVTFLLLSKPSADAPEGFAPLELLDEILPLYETLLGLLRDAGAAWVQLDEPALVTDQSREVLDATRRAYQRLGVTVHRPKLLVATYFDVLGDALPVLRDTPIDGLALDFTGPAASNLEQLAAAGGLPGKRLVAGVVNGRNVWINDLQASLATLGALLGLAGEIVVAPSSSLLHVPIDLAGERDLDPQIGRWLAFARQKVTETVTLARGLGGGATAIAGFIEANHADLASRASSPITRDPAVRSRMESVSGDDARRKDSYAVRSKVQADRLRLPLLPTTTIGSFPQTRSLRQARAALRQGRLTTQAYDEQMRDEVRHVIALQEELGIDVLVHGEPERNDMVQYFAEQLIGVLSTRNGWVQSYGTRYVRPPIIAGDISRPAPMTVEWFAFAQSLTDRPVKGMLTGPVTMLCWSFVREDQPWAHTAQQMALALRDETLDLEAAGAAIIQVDEPALREGLPLRRSMWAGYLESAIEAFRLTTGGVRTETQIHTHMCYAEFGSVLDAIIALDADVISLEAARSAMAIVGELADVGYPAAVGPGVYDIHSPRIPDTAEIEELLGLALARLPADRLWVNPDCGLKTRGEAEVVESLRNLVAAATRRRHAHNM
jgi:5-methyltetrahydropteroyltriglutamate--homocysteine methyltransferase